MFAFWAPHGGLRGSCASSQQLRVHGDDHGRDRHEDRPKRSEEHTSELQSRLHLVCRLLLEKKKKLTLFLTFPSTSSILPPPLRPFIPTDGLTHTLPLLLITMLLLTDFYAVPHEDMLLLHTL